MFARAFPIVRLSLGRCAQNCSVPAAPHVFFLVAAVHLRGRSLVFRLSPLRSSRLSPRSFLQRPLRTALLAAARRLFSRRVFTRAFPTHSSAAPRSLYKEAFLACSFIRALLHSALSLALALASLLSALLCFACAPVMHRLCSRASPSASSLLVPLLSTLPGSTPLFNINERSQRKVLSTNISTVDVKVLSIKLKCNTVEIPIR